MFTADVDQPGHEARHPAGVVGAGDANNRDASILLAVKQVVDDGRTHRLAGTIGRLDVGQQARAGIDFDHGAPLLFQRQGAVF